MNKMEFLEKARKAHGYKYEYPNLCDEVKLKDKISVIFKGCNFIQTVSKHLSGRCPEKNTPKKTTEEYIQQCKKIWIDKYDYSLVEYTGALNMVKIIYDGVIYEQRAISHISGLAPEFRNNEDSIIKSNINESDEIGKKDIRNFLKKYEIEFIEGQKFDNLSFQFYLTKFRISIEYHSDIHISVLSDIDKIKSDYCEENYIDLIRIKYDQIDDIYRILWDNLKNRLP
jgi:hypothetical protein